MNPIQLLSTLQKYSALNEWYLGKKSVPVPMELHKPKKQLRKVKYFLKAEVYHEGIISKKNFLYIS